MCLEPTRRLVRFTEFSLYTVDEEGRVQSSPENMNNAPFPPSHPFISSVETPPENEVESLGPLPEPRTNGEKCGGTKLAAEAENINTFNHKEQV